MLSTLEALLLGLIQGVTEFLPISSSGHLVVTQHLLGLKETPLAYDVLLHLATFCATIAVLHRQVWVLIKACFRVPRFIQSLFQKGPLAVGDDPYAWMVLLILVSTAITGIIGVVFHDVFKKAFASLYVVAGSYLVTGLLLFLTRTIKEVAERKTPSEAKISDACLIGLAQGLAILPGLSRSGMTLSTALLRRFNRSFAGEYAFLVSLPAILGATIFEGRQGFDTAIISWPNAAGGFVVAFVCGVVSLRFLLGWIRSGKLSRFAFYCWGMALLCLTLALVL